MWHCGYFSVSRYIGLSDQRRQSWGVGGFDPPDFGMGVVRIAGGCGRVSKYHYSLFLYRKHVIFHRKYVGKWLISRNREKSKNIRLKSEIFFDRIHDPRFHARLTPLRQITGLRSHIATQTRSLATRCLTDHWDQYRLTGESPHRLVATQTCVAWRPIASKTNRLTDRTVATYM